MSDLRVYGFSLQVENSDGKQKIVEFRRAVTDLDGTVETLNDSLADNVTVTARKVQGDKEALAQARLLVTQNERQIAKTKSVINQYTTLNSTMQTYGNDLETVNAITRLGSNATEAQKQEVAELVAQYQLLRKSGDTAGTGMRNLRGVAQNLGWQMQDVAVQTQMGTSSLVIMSQQLPQMLSSFGAWGALAGAAVAIVGAAMPSLISYFTDATTSTKELEAAQKSVNAVLDQSSYTVKGVSNELKNLYDVNKSLAELKLVLAFQESEQALASYKGEIKDTFGTLLEEVTKRDEAMSKTTKGTTEYYRASELLGDANTRLSNKLGVLTLGFGKQNNMIVRLARSFKEFESTGNNEKLSESLTEITKASYGMNPEIREMISNYAELAAKSELSKNQLSALKDMVFGNKTVTGAHSEAVQTLTEKYQIMTEQLKMNDAQIALDNFLRKEGANATEAQKHEVAVLIAEYYNEKAAIEARATAAKKAQDEEKTRLKDLTKQYTKVRESLTGSNTPGATGAVSKEEALHAKNTAILENAKKSDLAISKDYNTLIEAENNRHTLAMQQAQLSVAQNNLNYLSQVEGFMSTVADELATGVGDVQDATDGMTDFQKAMFFVQRSISAASALVNGIELGTKLAAMYPVAAPAMMATGTALGGAASAAIMGTTFAGMFDAGGTIPSGQSGIVSEYGDELVNGVMVKGPARVTSREETADMMSGGGSTTLKVIVDNTNAPNVQYSAQQIDETTVKLIATQVFNNNVDSGVAGVLGKKNSKSDKSMRASYNVSRTY